MLDFLGRNVLVFLVLLDFVFIFFGFKSAFRDYVLVFLGFWLRQIQVLTSLDGSNRCLSGSDVTSPKRKKERGNLLISFVSCPFLR